ncbi:MAG: AAA family ATPase, partial [Gordonia sp. (in: high G+C Gram-positive bacteria)]
MAAPSLRLTARLQMSAADSRRGIVRVHPEVLAALSLHEWDGVSLTGARVSAAVVAEAPEDTPPGTLLLDEITMSNLGVREDSPVVLAPVVVHGAARVTVTGSTLATGVGEATLRRALLGKIVTVGDAISLLPRDLGPELAASEATQSLARSVGITWTNELLTVAATDPEGPVSVQMNTAMLWWDSLGGKPSAATSRGTADVSELADGSSMAATTSRTVPAPVPASIPTLQEHKVRPVSELVGVDPQVARLTEWLRVTLDTPDVLRSLGAQPRLGVMLSGPPGAGKATVARSVCDGRPLITIDGPTLGALNPDARVSGVRGALHKLQAQGTGVLLITDAETLLPVPAEPASTLILDELRTAVNSGTVALIATVSDESRLDNRLREPDLIDRELSISLPDAALRAKLLAVICKDVPVEKPLDFDAVAARTPGFVAADLAAVARDAALRA